jgi:hypothetical protein
MPEIFARTEPSLIPIARPRCPKCQGRMTPTRIEPDRPANVRMLRVRVRLQADGR